MFKVIDIIENDSITGVKYGLKEANRPVKEIQRTALFNMLNTKKQLKQITKRKTYTRQKVK